MSSRIPRPRLEDWLPVATLGLMTLLPLLEIVVRKVWVRGIPGTIPMVQHLTLWTAFLGAMLAARSDAHLSLSTATFLPERWRQPARLFTAALGAAVCTGLAWASIGLVQLEHKAGETVAWGIPAWVAVVVMPVGFALTGARLIGRATQSWRWRILVGASASLPLLMAAAAEPSRPALLWPAVLMLLAAAAAGLPIFAALGGAALLLFWAGGYPVSAVAVSGYTLTASPVLPAIPLFTLAGYILAQGGASRRLMHCFTAWMGWMPGGLAIVTTVILAFFTPLTGASGITILSMGGLLLPVMVKARYPESTSIGLVTVSGSIGLLLPPSLPVILYAVTAQQPIDRLFVASFIPGLVLIVVVAAWGASRGWLAGVPRSQFRLREAVVSAWQAKWELALPVVVLSVYFSGLATLVESAAMAVLYSFLVEFVLYRDLRLGRDFVPVTVQAATLVGAFLIILGAALGFTNFLVQEEVPDLAMQWVRAHVSSPLVFLLALNVFLLIVGALMDIYSAIIVVVPIILPMGVAYGIDPVHLGVIFLANMELGYLMPPMGENLFLSSVRFHQPVMRICRATLPYTLILLGAVLLITYVPAMTLAPLEWWGGE